MPVNLPFSSSSSTTVPPLPPSSLTESTATTTTAPTTNLIDQSQRNDQPQIDLRRRPSSQLPPQTQQQPLSLVLTGPAQQPTLIREPYTSHFTTLASLFNSFRLLLTKRKFKWRQQYYFYVHIIYIVLVGLFMSLIVYLIELKKSKKSFIDCMFQAYSAVCITGLVSFDITSVSVVSQVIIMLGLLLGGLTLTTIPALIIKIFMARNLRQKWRQKLLGIQNARDQEVHEAEDVDINSERSFHVTQRSASRSDLTEDDSSDDEHNTVTTPKGNNEHNHSIPGSEGVGMGQLTGGSSDTVLQSSSTSDEQQQEQSQTQISLPAQQPLPATQTEAEALPPPPQPQQQQSSSVQSDAPPSLITSRKRSPSDYSVHSEDLQIRLDETDGTIRIHKDYSTIVTIDDFSALRKTIAKKDAELGRKVYDAERDPLDQMDQKRIEPILKHKQPPVSDVEYLALLSLLGLILLTVAVIHITCFIILGITLELDKANLSGVNPWYGAIYLTISGFSNAGIVPWPDNVMRFAKNVVVNLVIMFLIISGNTCFPIMLRFLVWICYKLSRKNKVVFKYMLDKHHHLTLHLFPALQTRVYATITILLQIVGTVVTMALNYRSFPEFNGGWIFLFSLFQSVSTRAAGLNTIDISRLSIATLFCYIIMMRIKPQMVCNLKDGAYHMDRVEKRLKAEEDDLASRQVSSYSNHVDDTPRDRSSTMMNRRSVQEDLRVIEELIDYDSDEEQMTLPEVTSTHFSILKKIKIPLWLYAKVYTYVKKIWYHASHLLMRNNMWLVLIVLLICMAESDKLRNDSENFTFFKIVFEVISAFGNVGFSLGAKGTVASFSAVMTTFSKLLIILTMVLGRHRGLNGSMLDQEYQSYMKKKI